MEALDKLLIMQQSDFEGIFEAMQGHPVTVRLLDPPMHEFLPDKEELLVDVTKLQITSPGSEELKEKEYLLKKVSQLAEMNPMLGIVVVVWECLIQKFMKCKQKQFLMPL